MSPSNRKKEIAAIKTEISRIQAEIHQLDLWFIKNIKSKDWNHEINHYWLLQARAEELTDQCKRMSAGKSRLLPHVHTYQIPPR